MAELKPCPFCGGNSIGAEISYEEKNFRIYCCDCIAEMVLYFADAGLSGGEIIGFAEMQEIIEELIEKWNTRFADNGKTIPQKLNHNSLCETETYKVGG